MPRNVLAETLAEIADGDNFMPVTQPEAQERWSNDPPPGGPKASGRALKAVGFPGVVSPRPKFSSGFSSHVSSPCCFKPCLESGLVGLASRSPCQVDTSAVDVFPRRSPLLRISPQPMEDQHDVIRT